MGEQTNFVPSSEIEKGDEWVKPQTCDITEIVMFDDLGNTRVNIGWENVRGFSNSYDSKLPLMLSKILQLAGLDEASANKNVKNIVAHSEGDREVDTYGVEEFNLDLNDLMKLTGKGEVDTRTLIGEIREHFLNQE